MWFIYLLFVSFALSAPVKIVTRVHTAEAVTTTQTHTTGTTTVWLPPVELFISNGVTFTFTQNDQPATIPTTYTSVYNDQTQQKAETTENTPATENAPATTEANTPATTEAAPAEATTEATTDAPADAPAETTPPQAKAPTTEADPETNEPAPTTSSTSPVTSTVTSTSTVSPDSPDTDTPTTTTSSPETTTSSSPSETTGSSGLLAVPWGIVYSPYADDGGCKPDSQVESDLQDISDKQIKHIRTYGTDCASLTTVLSTCSKLGIKVNQGLWMSDQGPDSIDSSVKDLVSYIQENGDDVFDFITIANEAIVTGYTDVKSLLSKISDVKKQLQSAGYSGKVTTAEPPVSYTKHPDLCDSNSPIDFVSINPHSYFNQDIDASEAGSFIKTELNMVKDACSGKDVKITETGYPSKGDTNGKNVPSKANQKIAIESIMKETGGDITILTTFDDYWKQPGPYNIEQFFGAAYLFE